MLSLGFFLFGVTAWLTAVLGPPLLGLWFWQAATERFAAWLAYLFFPVVALVEWIAMRAIFFAAGDDGSGPPGVGLFLILPLAMFAGALIVFYIAVGWAVIRAAWRRANLR